VRPGVSRRRRWWFTLLAHFWVICHLALDDTQQSALSPFYSAWNGFASVSSLELVDGGVYGPSMSIGAATSPLTPEPFIDAYNINITQGYQKQGVKA
jgi:hypothetical protein